MISPTILKTFFYTCIVFMLFGIKGCFRKNNSENSSKTVTNSVLEPSSNNKQGSITSLSASKFKALIVEKEVQLVDVRTPKEYNQGKIEDAILIDFTSKNFEEQIDAQLSIDIPVAVYCRSGRRSMMASKKLVEKGYTVYNLKGGYNSWK